MGNYYRINARFDLDDDEERNAVEFLKDLRAKDHRSVSSFIVEAVCEKIRKPDLVNNLLEDIGNVVKTAIQSELGNIYVISSGENASQFQHSLYDEKISREEMEESVLGALDAFGC